MLASTDGGVTWHAGLPPPTFPPASTAETFGDALLDRQGNCYLGVHVLNGDLETSRYVFLQQAPSDDNLRLISIPNSVNEGGPRFITPDGHGSRLIFASYQHGVGSWAYLLAGAAGETGNDVLIWRSVPFGTIGLARCSGIRPH